MSSSVEREEEGRGATDFFKMGLGSLVYLRGRRDRKKDDEEDRLKRQQANADPITNPYRRKCHFLFIYFASRFIPSFE